MSFLDHWSKKLEASFSEFAELAAKVPDIDLNFGIIGTALLWPVRDALEDDEGYDTLFEICGPKANQLLRAMRKWEDDPQIAACDLAKQAQTNEKLQAALTSLIEHFDAATQFAEKLAEVLVQQGNGDVYNLAGQIKAALVNIGGTTNIQSLTVQITQTSPAPSTPDIPPPPEPPALPEIGEFVGREEELAYFSKKLTTTHQAIICGLAGIGKTVVAAMLAHVWQAQNLLSPDAAVNASPTVKHSKIFWHTFYAGEGVHTLIWKLAGFLACHGQDEVWQMLNKTQQAGGQSPPATALFDYIFQLIQGQKYLLCLDGFQFINNDPALEDFINRLQMAVEPGDLDLIITSRQFPDFFKTTTVDPLSGLRLVDMQQLLKARDLSLSEESAGDLYHRTAGNPQLLILAINALKRAKQPAQILSRLAEVDDLERYLIKEVDDGLSEDDREVMIGVATLLGYPGSRYAIETTLERRRLKRLILKLSDRYLLLVHENEVGESYNQHVMLQNFYYDIPSPRERREMHRRAGEYYETDEPKSLRAALHYQRAGLFEKAAALVSQYTWKFINEGYAMILRQLLERFTAKQITPEQWVEVNLALGAVYTFLAERPLAKESYQTVLTLAESFVATHKARFTAQGCLGLGELLQYESPAEALAWFEQGLLSAKNAKAPEEVALYIKIGTVQIAMGNYAEALQAVEQGLALLPEGPGELRISGLINLAIINSFQKNIQAATEVVLQALDLARQLHDVFRMTGIWNNLGVYRMISGDWSGAANAYQEGLALAEQLGSPNKQFLFAINLGILYTKQGEFELAEAHLVKSLDLARQVGLRHFEPACLLHLADLHLRRDEIETAAPLLREAEQLAIDTETKYQLPDIYRLLALVRLATQQTEAALDYARQSVALAKEMEMGLEEGISQRVLGQVLDAAGNNAAAQAAFEKALSLISDQDPYEAAHTKLAWGQALITQGANEQGQQYLEAALNTFETLDAKHDQKQTAKIIQTF